MIRSMDALLARARREQAEWESLRSKVREALPGLVAVLVREYGVRRVTLFGSLLRSAPWCLRQVRRSRPRLRPVHRFHPRPLRRLCPRRLLRASWRLCRVRRNPQRRSISRCQPTRRLAQLCATRVTRPADVTST